MLETVAFTGPMLDAGHWMLVEDPAMRESETNGSAVKNLQRSDGVLECWSPKPRKSVLNFKASQGWGF